MSESKILANDPRPPYVQIADDIRASIAAGTLKTGDRIRSARLLSEAYGVAPMTIWQALRVLKAEGLLVSWKGRGVFVGEPAADVSEAEEGDLIERLDDVLAQLRSLEQRVTAIEAARK
ncbi:GntR family transcriptional regulator [Allocatelliglobosispora scoriae]|uniref:GntR family transcriptional regulator n=1 Tax=Allocatelliglobosispora scoriae TaxID=643052 RepID=A0A841BUM8_9ACTN|nr:GntR family transcriptional regulator [Allocatelliglobosispora scoriae]MBB5871156.1 GntR family transcriptional regulator [Allocatelliglobosispora scoriae]